MRDLSARLRAIVQKDRAAVHGGEARPAPGTDSSDAVVEPVVSLDWGGDMAARCLVLDHRHAAERPHGRRSIETALPREGLPLALFDPRAAGLASDWWRRVVYFDIETTGLSGGAGTLAFLVGCGWFETNGDFTVRQFFLTSPSGEREMLDQLARIFDDASLVVTYNGRTFDVPFMEMRWAFHRASAPTGDLPHFDMLPPARRLWGPRDRAVPESEGCSLSALERRVLGFHRQDDVPGFEIPARYFQFLRTGDLSIIEGVLEHNRHDLISLAALMAHALWLAHEGPLACREAAEQIALGRLYERAGRADAALEAFELAGRTGDAPDARQAFGHAALLHRRAGRHAEAAAAWQQVVDRVPRSRRRLTPLERQAVEALAIHHEHRAKDLEQARRYAETLGAATDGRQKSETERRLNRLARKLARSGGSGTLYETGH
jgi:uncharacterized protein YprB with RNaseH-like and TPR domain